MDWQTLTVAAILLLAVVYLVWRYLRRKGSPEACANCMAHQRLSNAKRIASKD